VRVERYITDAQVVVTENLEAALLLNSVMLAFGSPAHDRLFVTLHSFAGTRQSKVFFEWIELGFMFRHARSQMFELFVKKRLTWRGVSAHHFDGHRSEVWWSSTSSFSLERGRIVIAYQWDKPVECPSGPMTPTCQTSRRPSTCFSRKIERIPTGSFGRRQNTPRASGRGWSW
jgi:hypothetical protein